MPVTEEEIDIRKLGRRTWCIQYAPIDDFGSYHVDYSDVSRCNAVRQYLPWLNRQLANAELEEELGDLDWDAEDEEE